MAQKDSVALEIKKNEYKGSIDDITGKIIALMNQYDESKATRMFKDDIMNIISNLQKAVENESIKRGDLDKAINQISEKIGEEISKKIKESEDESNKSKHSNAIIRLIENIIRQIMNYRASKATTKHNKDLHTSFMKEELNRGYIISSNKDDIEKRLMPYFVNSLKSIVQKRELITKVELQRIANEISETELLEVTRVIAPLKEELSKVRAQFSDLQEKSIITEGIQANVILELQNDNEALKKQVTELTNKLKDGEVELETLLEANKILEEIARNDIKVLKETTLALEDFMKFKPHDMVKALQDIQSRADSLKGSVTTFNATQTSIKKGLPEKYVNNVRSAQSLSDNKISNDTKYITNKGHGR